MTDPTVPVRRRHGGGRRRWRGGPLAGALVLVGAGLGACADDEPVADRDVATTEAEAPAEAPDETPAGGRPPLPRPDLGPPPPDHSLDAVPADVVPEAWEDLPPRPELVGPLAVDDVLTTAPRFGEDVLEGAEDVAPGLDGHLYTGTADGIVWRLVTDGPDIAAVEEVARFAGRPLGLAAYDEETLVVAVAEQGLMALDLGTGESWVLADRVDDRLIFFADGVDVAADGTIYFTEASTRYLPGFPPDLLDGRPSGRVLRFEPATEEVAVVADELYFANGIVVEPGEEAVLVAESFRFRVTRIAVDGPDAGTATPFGPTLINGADNLRADDEGRIWVGGSNLRDDLVDAVLSSSELRRQLADDPDGVASARAPYGFALVLDADGTVLASWHDTTGVLSDVSGATPHDGHVTFARLRGAGVARMPVDDLLSS